jgi:hypothetical protein
MDVTRLEKEIFHFSLVERNSTKENILNIHSQKFKEYEISSVYSLSLCRAQNQDNTMDVLLGVTKDSNSS